MYICTCVIMDVCPNHVHACMCFSVGVCLCIWFANVCMHKCIFVLMFARVYVCVYIYGWGINDLYVCVEPNHWIGDVYVCVHCRYG